jgi:hypothetical protein
VILPCAARGQEQKLSSVEIKRLITGKTVTDEVHYTDKFKVGGVYEGVFMNKHLTGSWKVKDGQLCITRGSDPETCDEFWRMGNKLQRRRSGLPNIRDYVIVSSK